MGFRRQFTKLTRGSWSPNNPVVPQFPNARNRAELISMREAALEWEIEQANREIQKEDDAELRAEEREYNSYSAVNARMRQAGMNPDLLGSSGGSGGSGSSYPISPDFQDADLEDMPNPYRTAETVFSGISSLGGLVSSVTTGLTQGLDFVRMFQTMPDYKRAAKSAAEISANQSALSSLELANQSLMFAGSVADSLNPDQEITDNVIRNAIANTGYNDTDDQMFNTTKRLINTPEMRARYDDMKVRARNSRAMEMHYTFDLFDKIAGFQVKTDAALAEYDALESQFNLWIEDLYATKENAQQVGANMNESLDLESTGISFESEKLNQARKEYENYIRGYCEQLSFTKQQINNLEARLAEYYKAEQTSAVIAEIASMQVHLSELRSLGTRKMSEVYGIAKRIARDDYLADYFYDVHGGESRLTTDGKNNVRDVPLNLQHNAFTEMLFSDYLTSGMTFDQLAGNILGVGASVYNGSVGAGVSMRGQNINAYNAAQSRAVFQRGQNMGFYRTTRLLPHMFPMIK